MEEEAAAVMIQSKVRQFQAKKRVSIMRQEKKAATTIQAGYRGFKARQQVQIMRWAAVQRFRPWLIYRVAQRSKPLSSVVIKSY